ncbi:hypothetical protein STCU_01617 [Strigomonas culicis]|uniref:HECT domain-containing protein n=1 Tax=Strigomonas culicis TaxID=28005 RepID=S9V021_9TRYP|nr:hypothetical protein STCU_01617 [Strigomonas culicis]|eukprot:EPY34373.1 hypothetical protein STCU_01617 [Strigomonas culicis]
MLPQQSRPTLPRALLLHPRMTTVAAAEPASRHTKSLSIPMLPSLFGAGALDDKVDLLPLGSYCYRLKLFDSLTISFSPLINLHRKSELFSIFRVLKNVCSKETEERIQEEVMRPFQHRAGRKAHVTLHTMQARPSATLGPYPTLMRSIFGQLYLQLHRSTNDTFHASPIFTVKLAGFGSTDAGGPYRDVLSQLASEIMTPHPGKAFQLNPLFMQMGNEEDSAVVMPNVKMLESSQTPLMLEFFGKLLASFFVTNDLLAVEFPPLFWKLLLGEHCSKADICALDTRLLTDLDPMHLLERSAEEMEERFPGIGETWSTIVAENPHLSFGGVHFPPATAEGAELLIARVLETEVGRFRDVVSYIHSGFDQVVPLYTLQAFRWQKVELLICGSRRLSFEAFRSECDIQLPSDDCAMFLSVLETMTDEDRTLLLRFITGQSRLPLKSRIKVQHSGNKNTLPTSSTCLFYGGGCRPYSVGSRR